VRPQTASEFSPGVQPNFPTHPLRSHNDYPSVDADQGGRKYEVLASFQNRKNEPSGWTPFDVMVRKVWHGVFIALAGCGSVLAQGLSAAPTIGTIIDRMADARNENRARFHRYIVTRNYTLFGKERHRAKAEVTAELTFVPPNAKTYSIQQHSGSGLGEKLVRKMLDGETEIVRENGSTDLSPDNYSFRLIGEDSIEGRSCYVIEIRPRRRDKTLLRGTIWVDSGTYLLHRLEGEPAKSPSWWLRRSKVKFSYGDVDGMWLQTASEFTTHVRIFGQHTMVSRDVKYQTKSARAAPVTFPVSPISRPTSHVTLRPRYGIAEVSRKGP